jgi:hypothetical protein
MQLFNNIIIRLLATLHPGSKISLRILSISIKCSFFSLPPCFVKICGGLNNLITMHVNTACSGKTPCPSLLLVVDRHPVCPYCWWYRDTLHVHAGGGGEVPCTSVLLVVERYPARTYCRWWRDTLHEHTAGIGKTSCIITELL